MCVLLAALAVSAVAAPATKPNIILIVTDDLGADLGCYGNPVIQTPHLDALAKDGVRMTHAFCTTASCSASRSVILTGLFNHANAHYGHAHAYHHFSAYPNVKSLPVLLAGAGYRTGRIGKLHVEPAEVFAWQSVFKANERNPVQMANSCREFLAATSDQPFFLYFCPADPHRSGGKAPEHADLPADLQPNPFGNTAAGYPGVTEVKYDPRDVIVPPFLPDSPACRAELAQYYQSVSRIDQGIGRLIALLKEAGRYDNSLLIFTSDHGIAFPGGKTTVYEPGMRVPFLVKLPGGTPGLGSQESGASQAETAGQTSAAMISHVDLVPTLLDFAGALPADHQLHGRSWKEAIRAEKPAGWDRVYASHTFHEITMYYPMRVVRAGNHKLIWNIAAPLPYPFASDLWDSPAWQAAFRQGPKAPYGKRTVHDYIHRAPFELYDLQADPDETKNLAGDPSRAKLLAELKGNLKEFQQRTKDPWVLKWDYE
ncbi:MAG: sulfatase [Pirellulaceae bacterium]|nr:sulfatase [Pirellulaceae bacterium]